MLVRQMCAINLCDHSIMIYYLAAIPRVGKLNPWVLDNLDDNYKAIRLEAYNALLICLNPLSQKKNSGVFALTKLEKDND